MRDCPDCTLCDLHCQGNDIPRHVGLGTRYFPSSEPLDYDPGHVLVYVGQNPGFNEDREGEPFIGRSGQILKEAYIGGIDATAHAHVYLTNSVRCHTVNNAPPANKHIKACAVHLQQDLEGIALEHRPIPMSLVFLGAKAVRSFHLHLREEPYRSSSLKRGMTENGTVHSLHGGLQATVFAFYHPAAILRNRSLINVVSDHNYLLLAHLTGSLTPVTKPTIIPRRNPIP